MVLNCKIPSVDRNVALLVNIQKGTDIIKKRYLFIENNDKFKKYRVDNYIFKDGSHLLTCSTWGS